MSFLRKTFFDVDKKFHLHDNFFRVKSKFYCLTGKFILIEFSGFSRFFFLPNCQIQGYFKVSGRVTILI